MSKFEVKVMQKKWFVRIMAVLLAVLLVGSVLIGVVGSGVSASAVTQSEIDDLKQESADLAQQKADVQAQIDSAAYEQSTALEKKSVLDEQMQLTQQEIDNVQAQIDEYAAMIAQKEIEVQEAQAAEDEQLDLYKKRVRTMEEDGAVSYLEVIFQANSFADLLARIDLVGEIMEYDNQLYADLQAAKQATIDAKNSLESAKEEEEAAKAELEAKESELSGQIEESAQLIAQIEEDIQEYEDYQASIEASEAAVAAKISELVTQMEQEEAERKAAEEAAKANQASNESDSSDNSDNSASSDSSNDEFVSNGSGTVNGSFIWPAPDSHYLTSYFGWRIHPIYGYEKYHSGIDIGASYGTNVLAADGGTVIISDYDAGGYGNYVVISHGNGLTTLYGHMSTVYVSAGDTVSQGDVIGLVGSTGASTGPHLHFEVAIYGERTDPLNYVS
jgi:murein DD-endopeptidase MepM/ murein hydrolase activator NlpD